MRSSPLRQFVLAAALWLPMAFFLWAVLASAVIWPVARITDWILPAWLPHVVQGIEQAGAQLEVVTRLQTGTDPQGRVGLLVLSINPLIYAWCIALYAGLVMATPLGARQRAVQLAVGIGVLWLTTSWGAVFDALKLLAFDAGPLGAAAISRAGLSVDAIALGYQFGYLILPAVTPIALWVVQNRVFLEQLVGWPGEPRPVDSGRRADMNSEPTRDKR